TPAPQVAPLLALQTALPLVGNAALLFGPLSLLVLNPGSPPVQVGQAGGPLGWVGLLLAGVVAVAYAGRALISLRIHLLCGLGLAVGVLAACSAARSDSSLWLAYHVLALAWVLLGVMILGTARFVQRGTVAVPMWVATVGGLVVALALRGIGDDPAAPWWPAGMTIAVGALWAGLAVWQRSEGWALAAGLCVNLAVTLILGHGRSLDELLVGWVPLVQANVITSAAVALMWLTAARRLPEGEIPAEPGAEGSAGASPSRLARTPGLSGQVTLGLVGNLLLLVHPTVLLILQPGELPDSVRQAGSVAGWVALLAAVVPAVWYAGPRLLPRAVPIL